MVTAEGDPTGRKYLLDCPRKHLVVFGVPNGAGKQDQIGVLQPGNDNVDIVPLEDDLAEAAAGDKKRVSDNIVIVYPDQPGRCKTKELPVSELEDFIARGVRLWK